MSDSSKLLDELKGRLEQIKKSNGYFTDAGNHVFLGRLIDVDRNDPVPSLTFSETDEGAVMTSDSAPQALMMDWMLAVDGYIEVDPDHPLTMLLRLWSDIVRAVYRTDDRRFGTMGVNLTPSKRHLFPPESWGKHGAVRVIFKVTYVEEFTDG